MRASPIQKELEKAGAVFTEVLGWERPLIFNYDAASKAKAESDNDALFRPAAYDYQGHTETYEACGLKVGEAIDHEKDPYLSFLKGYYTWGKWDCWEQIRAENDLCRNKVAAFDTSSLSKIRVTGADAEKFLQYAVTANVSAPHCVKYTCLLNKDGGIESDFTVNKRSETDFYIVVAGATGQKDFDFFTKLRNSENFVNSDIKVEDVSTDFGVLNVQGRFSRKIMEKIAPNSEFSNESFPAYTEKQIEISGAKVHALRVLNFP